MLIRLLKRKTEVFFLNFNYTKLKHGYQIKITTSEYPLPSICANDQLNDWFEGLAVCLHWNDRRKQLPLNTCYLDKSKNGAQQSTSSIASNSSEGATSNNNNK